MAVSSARISNDGLGMSKLARLASYSFVTELEVDPKSTEHMPNKVSRQVFTGHYVDVQPTMLPNPEYVAHCPSLFAVLDLPAEVATQDAHFIRFFSGDMDGVRTQLGDAFRPLGWATGYALSIFGQEYTSNCPFRTGNGYGDGRAMSVLEVRLDTADGEPENDSLPATTPRRLEFQLKGGGTTPYCRGGDGRAVLRSSIREFLVSEAMHALGVPTSRALCLYASTTERVMRPWYTPGSTSEDPDTTILEPTAISTRVAPSFIRVGQLELFARRARKQEHPNATRELEQLVQHLIKREYPELVSQSTTLSLDMEAKERETLYLALAETFGVRLASLVANWIRVGYCQGNFNSDNCAAGGWTLDYGPFGFVERYDPEFQMWTGGGQHFSFMNQPTAAAMNYKMFIMSLVPLFRDESKSQLNGVLRSFPLKTQAAMEAMLAKKLGLLSLDSIALWQTLDGLLQSSAADWTIFWRTLSMSLPTSVSTLKAAGCFYTSVDESPVTIDDTAWDKWLSEWHAALKKEARQPDEVMKSMRRSNPKYIPREWMLVAAYQAAGGEEGGRDYRMVRELQHVFDNPYGEQSDDVSQKYFRRKDDGLFGVGGVSHCSCSS